MILPANCLNDCAINKEFSIVFTVFTDRHRSPQSLKLKAFIFLPDSPVMLSILNWLMIPTKVFEDLPLSWLKIL